jgi:hypothetical protein
LPKLRCMDDAVTELAGYFRARAPVPDGELIRLTAAARAGGHRWASIAAACGVTTSRDTDGIVSEQIAAGLALRCWTPDAAQLPWVQHAYPPAGAGN